MEERAFLDSNIIVYLLSGDERKKAAALGLLARRPFISVQVLNEVTNVCRKKARMSWDDIDAFVADIKHFCTICSLTEAVHDAARRIASKHQIAFYDANILAAARESGASVVWSEDMHHGLVIDGALSVANPFRA